MENPERAGDKFVRSGDAREDERRSRAVEAGKENRASRSERPIKDQASRDFITDRRIECERACVREDRAFDKTTLNLIREAGDMLP